MGGAINTKPDPVRDGASVTASVPEEPGSGAPGRSRCSGAVRVGRGLVRRSRRWRGSVGGTLRGGLARLAGGLPAARLPDPALSGLVTVVGDHDLLDEGVPNHVAVG